MAGISPTGPVTGVNGLVFIDENPESPAEVVTGNPWPSPGGPGYIAQPLRYPGQLWSQGYGERPQLPSPETGLVDDDSSYPVDVAVTAGPGTPYFDATPNTHAGPWPHPVTDNHLPDGAAYMREQSAALHADGLDNRKPGLIVAELQDDWAEYWNGPADGAMITEGGQNRRVSAGWGSTDVTQNPAGINQTEDYGLHGHRRVATGKNLPMNFQWMPGGGRPLVNTAHGLQALPTGPGSPYEGQDPSYGYGTAGAVLTVPAGDYEAPATPYQAPPLTQQNLLEGPL